MELLKTLAQQFITDTDNDGNIDANEVIASMATLLTGSGSQLNLGSIVSNLQGSGLSDIAASWLGDGENKSILPEQIASMFNSDQLSAFWIGVES